MERAEVMLSGLVRLEPDMETEMVAELKTRKDPARVMLDKRKEMAGRKEEKTKKNSMLNKEKENGKKKRRKKVMVSVGEDYIQYLKEQTLPPPYQPTRVLCSLATELEELIVARDKAEREERERILKQHKDKGFPEMEVVITVEEEEEKEEV